MQTTLKLKWECHPLASTSPNGPPADKSHLICVEAAELRLNLKKDLRVAHRRFDFSAATNDGRVFDKTINVLFGEACWPTSSGLKMANRRRYPALFWRIVLQLRPACAPSKTKSSKSRVSSRIRTPHSSSWYSRNIGGAQGHRGFARLLMTPPQGRYVRLARLPDIFNFHHSLSGGTPTLHWPGGYVPLTAKSPTIRAL